MADHLTEEEQLEQLKTWWKDNGFSLIAAVLVGLIAYFGFQWWQNHQQQQAEQASALYGQLVESIQANPANGNAVSEEDKKTAFYLAEQLRTDYSNSLYAVNASLFAAKIAVEENDLETAVSSLKWAVDNSRDAMQGIASLRLARLYLAKEQYDEALALVNTDIESLQSMSAELRGDILLAKNDVKGAKAAYQEALDSVGETTSIRRQLLPIKIANLSDSGES